jgi:hypothetical protein
MTDILIIKSNDINYLESDMIRTNFTHEKISEILEPYCEFVKLSNTQNDSLMEIIIKSLFEDMNIDEEMNTKLGIYTGSVSHINNELYQICHLYITKDIFDDMINSNIQLKYNGIARYLTDGNVPVFGNAVMFKIDTFNDNNILNTLKNDELVDQFIYKFIHKGIVLGIDGEIDETIYVFNPVDWISPQEITNYKYVECEILDKILMIFYDNRNLNDDSKINNIGTSIYNSDLLYGRLILGLRDITETETIRYIDLTHETMKNIIQVFHINKEDKKMTKDEDIDQILINGKRFYNNFHKILNTRLNKYIK